MKKNNKMKKIRSLKELRAQKEQLNQHTTELRALIAADLLILKEKAKPRNLISIALGEGDKSKDEPVSHKSRLSQWAHRFLGRSEHGVKAGLKGVVHTFVTKLFN